MRQCFTSEFPTHPNREFFVALQACRELNQAITEFLGRIREEGAAIAALAS
jgi:hypothetical protein